MRKRSTIHERIDKLEECLKAVDASVGGLSRRLAELNWANIFHDAIVDSTWLKNSKFHPGRWAVGYAYLYVLYRILDEAQPKCILDIGLGETSRMISQYAAAHPEVEHIIIESSQEWIDFFSRSCTLPPNSRIIRLDLEKVTFEGAKGVRAYRGFAKALKGKKFDYISIDGPLSGDMKEIGRVDVQSIIPECLAGSFVVTFDDTNRAQDRKSFDILIANIMKSRDDVSTGRYIGEKEFRMAVSKDLSYLKSM